MNFEVHPDAEHVTCQIAPELRKPLSNEPCMYGHQTAIHFFSICARYADITVAYKAFT